MKGRGRTENRWGEDGKWWLGGRDNKGLGMGWREGNGGGDWEEW